jgi:hypothetical protein
MGRAGRGVRGRVVLWAAVRSIWSQEAVLVTFPAQRIVLFTRPGSEQRYDEGIHADALQQRFGLRVQQAE